ncbi:EF-hand domain-containing protein [Streptomyces griseoviridis]|uniref:Calcium-binding protein n=2 Tax=Streptomyces TaxID=1883 RepID=A0A3Q9KSI4_STRGD|nr:MULTISPECIES: calcium-binding protein [Streptomyces]AZS82957.1 calcium-binding protein [Streptomyces griseoviridis]MDH6695652.1 Ca2+-binding EF-hand superfamily protein [Streptomyces sp. MAA16]MDT0470708.1 calcium-binding protein [Streptomyces sp. DSM 41014]QCN90192.1 calcium-binding protein [Streptomyces griseoviridis]
MGELLDWKYERLFSLLDANSDGVIAQDDFTLMAGRVLEATGEQRTAKGEAYKGAMMNYWLSLRQTADADGNGRVDKNEFRSALRRVSVDFDTLIGPLYQAGFRLADRDGDGLVARQEFTTVLVAIGVPATQAESAFDGLADQDGRLTESRLMHAAGVFYRDENPDNSASHLLFGAS